MRKFILRRGLTAWLLIISGGIAGLETWGGRIYRDKQTVSSNVSCIGSEAKPSEEREEESTVFLELNCGGKIVTTADRYAVASRINKPSQPIFCNILRDETAVCDDPKEK